MRGMVRGADGKTALAEVKAVDSAYPLYGRVVTEPAGDIASLLERRGDAFGGIVDPELLKRLGLAPGARVTLGAATIELRATLTSEPDKLAGGLGFGPRLIISEAALRASALLQPGSLVRWTYRLRLPAAASSDADAKAVVDAANAALPESGFEIRNRNNAAPQLERNIERFSQYLTLVGLTALLVGGVGVANSAKHYLDGKRSVIATMKSLGATGTTVVAIYFVEVLLLAAIGIAIGLVLGAALPFVVVAAFGHVLPLAIRARPVSRPARPRARLRRAHHGDVCAVAARTRPRSAGLGAVSRRGRAGAAHAAPALYRGDLLAAGTLAAFAVAAAYDRRIAIVFIVSALVVFGALRLVAMAVMAIARRVGRPRSTVLRLAVANIYRPGALTPTVVISLGLGIAVLVTVIEIDANLRQEFATVLPEKAPSFYFLDIPARDAARFDTFVRSTAPRADLERVPMLRGRIVAARGVKAEDLAAKPDAAWALQSDRGLTFTADLPTGSRLIEGEWWSKDYSGPPLVSFEKKVAEGLGLKIGDEVVVNVLGRNMTAHIANLRTVDWQSLGINFVMVFSPGAFAGAPVTDIATVNFPGGGSTPEETALMAGVTDAFPGVTAVRVKDAIDAFRAIVSNLVVGVRSASAVTLVAAVLVLAGALAAGHRHRVYDAVILKTLGATRRQLLTAYAVEYLLIGSATVAFGVVAGSLAGWGVVVHFMSLPYHWQGAPALAAAAAAVLLTVFLGLAGTWPALSHKPAPVLRNL